jgi:hypothetical protein
MKKATPQEVNRLLFKQRCLESLGAKLAISMLSKIPKEQADLLPAEDRHLAGKKAEQKTRAAARRKILPAFLRRRLTRWTTILKLKLLALSLKASSSSYWFLRRTTWRMLATKFSRRNTRRTSPAASPTRPSSPKKKNSFSVASPSGSGENISGTNICSATKPSPPSTSSNIACEI